MIDDLIRPALDEILFDALRAIYQFERVKVSLFDLTYEEIYLLQFLRRKSVVPMTEIAGEMHIPVSTATRLIDRLERRHLVYRRKDETDRRKILVALAEEGEPLVARVEDHTFETVIENLKDFTGDEVRAFISTARCLDRILNLRGGHVKRMEDDRTD